MADKRNTSRTKRSGSSEIRSVLVVGGLSVEVVRKPQKNMYLRVKDPDARVCVSAPLRFTDAQIKRFVVSRWDWVEQHRAKALERARRRASSSNAESSTVPSEQDASPTKEEIAEWRAVVSAFVPVLVERWAPIMGVAPTKIAYRNMVSRWGSCNVKTGRICINVQLAAHPPECLEYVVVHELCHLLEASHGPRFKALMTRFLPDWRERERKLIGGIRR